jgi:hypothetical protein
METLDLASLLAEPAPLCWDRLHATNGPLGPLRPPAGDALDHALPWLVRHLGVADALSAVLEADAPAAGPAAATAQAAPDDQDGIRPDGHAGRLRGALRMIGYEGRLSPLALADLDARRLPALLLLRSGDACVLTRCTDRHGERLLHVVMPGRPPIGFTLPQAALAAEYTGVALLLRPLDGTAPAAPPTAAQGPLARLALALQAALAPPEQAPAPGWRERLAGWLRRPGAAFKLGGRHPITP